MIAGRESGRSSKIPYTILTGWALQVRGTQSSLRLGNTAPMRLIAPARPHGCEPCVHACHPVSPHVRNGLPARKITIANVRRYRILPPPVSPLAVTLAVRAVPTAGGRLALDPVTAPQRDASAAEYKRLCGPLVPALSGPAADAAYTPLLTTIRATRMARQIMHSGCTDNALTMYAPCTLRAIPS